MERGNKFSVYEYINVYQKIHSNGKFYKCKEYGKILRRSGEICSSSNHDGEKPNECMFCGKSFRVHAQLTRHHKMHTRNLTDVWNVARTLDFIYSLLNIREFILVRNHTNVYTVKTVLELIHSSLNISKFTLVRNLIYVRNVRRLWCQRTCWTSENSYR